MQTRLDPRKKPSVWRNDNMLDRILMCAGMLKIHGFLTDAERERVQQRIVKWAGATPTPPEGGK